MAEPKRVLAEAPSVRRRHAIDRSRLDRSDRRRGRADPPEETCWRRGRGSGLWASLALVLAACKGPVAGSVGSEGRAPQPTGVASPAETREAATPRYLKGQLHLHSDASGDSDTPAAEVVRWYADAGFDFIVFTDHNRISAPPGTETMLVFPGVELTQNSERCEPEPEPGLSCLLHVNALFVDPERASLLSSKPAPTGLGRVERYRFGAELSRELGGLALLNHPNFHYGADASVIGAVAASTETQGAEPLLLEVANMAIDSNNAGDAEHPSTEGLWDQVLSEGHRVYGVATDDAHHYYDAEARRALGEEAFVGGRGFVMVRAEREEASLRGALARGDFYASDGLILERVQVDRDVLVIDVDVDGEGGAVTPVRITFIGEGGERLGEAQGGSARFELSRVPRGSYLRAEVVDARGKRAWVQPVWP